MNDQNTGFYCQLFGEDEIYLLEDKHELKDICLVLNEKLSTKNEIFLSKILTAVNLSIFSVSQLYSLNIKDIKKIETKIVIIFDDNAFPSIPFYEIIKEGELSILKSNSLNIINLDKNLKANLWKALQLVLKV